MLKPSSKIPSYAFINPKANPKVMPPVNGRPQLSNICEDTIPGIPLSVEFITVCAVNSDTVSNLLQSTFTI